MSIESQASLDQEKKLKTEAERKEEIAKSLEFSKEKQEVLERIGKKKELAFLKSLVERGLLGLHAAQIIASNDSLESEDIESIFEKIDAIESVPEIDKMLPGHLRLTKDEYAEAVENTDARTAALEKIDAALTHLYEYGNPNGATATLGVFFSGFMMMGKNLVKVQENTIDIKDSLLK